MFACAQFFNMNNRMLHYDIPSSVTLLTLILLTVTGEGKPYSLVEP